MEEVFKTIEGFEEYQVSNLGRVISNKHGNPKFLKPQTDAIGYQHVRLYPEDFSLGSYGGARGKKPKLYKVHKLVAETFIPKHTSTETLNVNHKDGDKTNNCVDNLEWTTQSENMKHSWDMGLRDNAADKAALKRYKPIKSILPDGTVQYYQSRKHLCLDLDIFSGLVTLQLRSDQPIKRGKLKGYRFINCPELPPGETYKQILNLEQKLLEYAKFQEYMRKKGKERREKLKKRK